ncbi:Uncharacterised protein [Segatella copri]|nr:Uncharacterised protein [Segatella copri]
MIFIGIPIVNLTHLALSMLTGRKIREEHLNSSLFTLPSSFFTYSQALKLISKPFTLCVKAPTEMKSTPCSA